MVDTGPSYLREELGPTSCSVITVSVHIPCYFFSVLKYFCFYFKNDSGDKEV